MKGKHDSTDASDERAEAAYESLLLSYDEAVSTGRQVDASCESDGEKTLPPDWKQRLHAAKECLQLLDEAWRSGELTASTVSAASTGIDVSSEDHRIESFDQSGEKSRDSRRSYEPLVVVPDAESLGTRPTLVGKFCIERELGRGATGIVLLARDTDVGRLVALKVPRPEVLVTKELRARFIREAQAAGSLSHPNIVPIFESGNDGPICYIAAEYVSGPNLAEWRHEQDGRIVPQLAAHIVAQLADGVEHAHRRGVLHRDIKPANVLLASNPLRRPGTDTEKQTTSNHRGQACDAAPQFIPKLTDFGLARLLEDAERYTRTGSLLGTLEYMAPEQARGEMSAGPSADVYALGAILYELLTGRPPFSGRTDSEILSQLLHGELVPPRKALKSALRGVGVHGGRDDDRIEHSNCAETNEGVSASTRIWESQAPIPFDVETICLKCLTKPPLERYATAQALADDLRRFLNREPIHARRTSLAERSFRWCQRKRALASLIGLSVVASIVIVVGSLWFNEQVRQRQRVADAERFYSLLTSARDSSFDDRPGWSWQALNTIAEAAQLDQAADHLVELRSATAKCLNAVDLRPIGDIASGMNPYCLAFDSDGDRLAVGQNHNIADDHVPVQVWDLKRRSQIVELTFPKRGERDGVRSVTFSPDGRFLAAGSRGGWIHIWDLAENPPIRREWEAHDDYVMGLCYTPDGKTLLSGSLDRRLKEWRTLDGRLQSTVELPSPLNGLSVSPDGTMVACALSTSVNVFFVDSFKPLTSFGRWAASRPDQVTASSDQVAVRSDQVAFSPNGQLLAAVGTGGELIEVSSGHSTKSLTDPEAGVAHETTVSAIQFHPDGSLLVTGGRDQRLKLWDVASGRLVGVQPIGSRTSVWPAFHPSGDFLAVSKDQGVRLFEVRGPKHWAILAPQPYPIRAFDLTATGDKIAVASPNHVDLGGSKVSVLDRRRGTTIREWQVPKMLEGTTKLAIDDEGKLIALADTQGSELWFGGPDDRICREFPARFPQAVAVDHVRQVLWASYRDSLATHHTAVGTIAALDWQTGELIEKWENVASEQRLAVSTFTSIAVGKHRLVAGSHDATVKAFNYVGRGGLELAAAATSNSGYVTTVTLNSDESVILAGTSQGGIMTVRAADGEVTSTLTPHGDSVTCVAFCGDRTLAASGARDRQVILWCCEGEQLEQLLSLRLPTRILQLEFTPDGRELLVLSQGETAVRVLRLESLRKELTALGIGW